MTGLIDWLEAQERFGAIGVAGISLGGVHASLGEKRRKREKAEKTRVAEKR